MAFGVIGACKQLSMPRTIMSSVISKANATPQMMRAESQLSGSCMGLVPKIADSWSARSQLRTRAARTAKRGYPNVTFTSS